MVSVECSDCQDQAILKPLIFIGNYIWLDYIWKLEEYFKRNQNSAHHDDLLYFRPEKNKMNISTFRVILKFLV